MMTMIIQCDVLCHAVAIGYFNQCTFYDRWFAYIRLFLLSFHCSRSLKLAALARCNSIFQRNSFMDAVTEVAADVFFRLFRTNYVN